MKQATVPQCSNCCRPYTVTGEGRQSVLRVPLLLGCGHSFCSVCVNQLGRVQRGTGVITCPQCAEKTVFLAGEEAARQLPSNIFILGLVAANKLNLGGKIPTNGVVSRSLIMRDNPSDIYIDLPSPLPADEFSIECEECKIVAAEVKCTTCKNYLCDKCFEMGHSAMAIFRSHVKIPITLAMSSPIHCSVHKGHMTQFYCHDDSAHLCSECVTMDTHKEHKVVSIQDEADNCRQQLKPMVVSARGILKRMKKSDKALAELLPRLHSHVEELIVDIHKDFSSLHYSLQLREQKILEQLVSEADSYVQPILRMRKMLQDNIAMATKTINNVQRLLGDSVAIVKSKQIVNSKLNHVLQMESHLHCDDGKPISYCMSESACSEMMLVGQIECSNEFRVSLSKSPNDGAVDEELVTSSDGQSHDSETPISSSLDHTPQEGSPKVREGVATQQVGVASQQMGVAHPPGLPMPATNQQQLQHHVRQLLQEVSSSDHLSSSDNDDHKINVTVPTARPATYQIVNHQKYDTRSSPLLWQQAASPKVDTTANDSSINVTPPSATVRDSDSLDTTPRVGGGPAEHCDDEDVVPTHVTRDNEGFGVAMATASAEDDAVINDVTADDDHDVLEQQTVKVLVSHIEDPGEFYVQHSSDHHNLSSLMTQLAEHCSSSPTPMRFTNAKPGLVCAAKFQEDDLWYRAEVLDTLQPSSVFIRYIDFGNKEWLNCKRLCVLPVEIISQPFYCHRCALNDLHPTEGSDWNMSLISRFKGIAMDTEFQMKVVYSDRHGNLVDLMLPPNGPWISSRLLETGLCTTTAGMASSIPTMKIPPNSPPDIGIQLECFVSYAHTPNEFYIQLPSMQLETLMIELQEYAVESHPLTTMLLPGKPCLAQFSLDDLWYRAVVMSVNVDKCDVKYVDYGNSELVAMEALQELQPKHCVLPEQALCCTLISACPPANGWSREVLQQFVDMVTNATLLLTVIDVIDGVVAMETVHETPINEFLSQSGIYQMKKSVPIATDIPAATVPAVGTICDAVIVNVQSPSDFHVQLLHSQYQLVNAMKAVDKQKSCPNKIEVGHCYLAVESTNMSVMLYRVCVVAAVATISEQYEVYFIDNGCYAKIEAQNLLEMPPSLIKVPSLAMHCSLDCVSPPISEEWSEQCLEFFSRLFLGKGVAITIKGIPDDPNDPVLVDMSVALPGAGRTEDVGAFLITNQFAQLATPPVLSYKPATPPSDGRVTVIHINDQGIVCCQAVNSAATLKKVMDLLQMVAKKGRHHPQLVIGQPCAAVFSEDNLWYRAKVVSMATRTAYVNFVDFGNNEDTLLENIYPIKSQDGDIIDVPIQCISVQLQGLENFDWSEELLTYMDGLILDRNCQLHVKGIQEGLVIGALSTGDCTDVAEKILQYINSTLPPLLDSSSGTNDTVLSAVGPAPQDHVISPLSSSSSKSLPQALLSHMTSPSQFSDHVIPAPRFPADHMMPKLPPLPNPTSNHDNHDDEVD